MREEQFEKENREKSLLYDRKLTAQGHSAKSVNNRYCIAQNRERAINAKKLSASAAPCKSPTGYEFFSRPRGVRDTKNLGGEIAALMAYRDSIRDDKEKADEYAILDEVLTAWFLTLGIDPVSGKKATKEAQKEGSLRVAKALKAYQLFVQDRNLILKESSYDKDAKVKWESEIERYRSVLDPDIPLNQQMDKLYGDEGLTKEEMSCGSILEAFFSERCRSDWYRDLVAMEDILKLPDAPGLREALRARMPLFKKPSETLTVEEIRDDLKCYEILFDEDKKDDDLLKKNYEKILPKLKASMSELYDFRISHPGAFAELSPMGLFYQVRELLGSFDKARGMRDILNGILHGNVLFVLNDKEREEFLEAYVEASATYDTLITRYQHLYREDAAFPGRPPASLSDILKMDMDYISTSYDYARVDAENDCRKSMERRLSCT